MTLMKWILIRRWQLKKWTADYSKKEAITLYFNMRKCNLSGINDHPSIQVDVQNILGLASSDFARFERGS